MRILYFTRAYTVHDARFLRELAASPHEIWFLPYFQAGGAEWRLPDRVQRARWPLPAAPADGSPDGAVASMAAFEEILSSVRPDVLHAGPIQPCGFMAALSGFHPLLLMSWGFDVLMEPEASDQARWIARFALRNADMLLCDCRAVREKASAIHPLDQDRVLELPWGVDLQAFRPGPPAGERGTRFGWGEEAFVILSTRAWEPIYGTETLLRSFRLALESNRRLRIVLVGSGSLSPLVSDFVSDPELRGAVHLAGAVAHEELPPYFQQADLYLSCSSVDGTSVSLLEAFASGLPAVVSDLPSNREWVLPRENGWLAPAGQPQDFARAILEAAAQDRGRLDSIGRANRKVAEARANWNANFPRILSAYENLAAAARVIRP
jgi:glycosyltransferase involved in cell wall biosynthesis